MRTKCLDCKYYDPQCNECNKNDHCPYAYRDDEACDKFEPRKKCEHRYENCDINGCSIICHSRPSERGCDFYYECKLDRRYCDEKCEKHEKRHKLNLLTEKLSKLYDSKRLLESLIEEYKKESHILKEEIDE